MQGLRHAYKTGMNLWHIQVGGFCIFLSDVFRVKWKLKSLGSGSSGLFHEERWGKHLSSLLCKEKWTEESGSMCVMKDAEDRDWWRSGHFCCLMKLQLTSLWPAANRLASDDHSYARNEDFLHVPEDEQASFIYSYVFISARFLTRGKRQIIELEWNEMKWKLKAG